MDILFNAPLPRRSYPGDLPLHSSSTLKSRLKESLGIYNYDCSIKPLGSTSKGRNKKKSHLPRSLNPPIKNKVDGKKVEHCEHPLEKSAAQSKCYACCVQISKQNNDILPRQTQTKKYNESSKNGHKNDTTRSVIGSSGCTKNGASKSITKSGALGNTGLSRKSTAESKWDSSTGFVDDETTRSISDDELEGTCSAENESNIENDAFELSACTENGSSKNAADCKLQSSYFIGNESNKNGACDDSERRSFTKDDASERTASVESESNKNAAVGSFECNNLIVDKNNTNITCNEFEACDSSEIESCRRNAAVNTFGGVVSTEDNCSKNVTTDKLESIASTDDDNENKNNTGGKLENCDLFMGDGRSRSSTGNCIVESCVSSENESANFARGRTHGEFGSCNPIENGTDKTNAREEGFVASMRTSTESSNDLTSCDTSPVSVASSGNQNGGHYESLHSEQNSTFELEKAFANFFLEGSQKSFDGIYSNGKGQRKDSKKLFTKAKAKRNKNALKKTIAVEEECSNQQYHTAKEPFRSIRTESSALGTSVTAQTSVAKRATMKKSETIAILPYPQGLRNLKCTVSCVGPKLMQSNVDKTAVQETSRKPKKPTKVPSISSIMKLESSADKRAFSKVFIIEDTVVKKMEGSCRRCSLVSASHSTNGVETHCSCRTPNRLKRNTSDGTAGCAKKNEIPSSIENAVEATLLRYGWKENKDGESTKFNFKWKVREVESDYRSLKPCQLFNHFENNRLLTTKIGLANTLKQHALKNSINIGGFFPRCYDVGVKNGRQNFLIDFCRLEALKVAMEIADANRKVPLAKIDTDCVNKYCADWRALSPFVERAAKDAIPLALQVLRSWVHTLEIEETLFPYVAMAQETVVKNESVIPKKLEYFLNCAICLREYCCSAQEKSLSASTVALEASLSSTVGGTVDKCNKGSQTSWKKHILEFAAKTLKNNVKNVSQKELLQCVEASALEMDPNCEGRFGQSLAAELDYHASLSTIMCSYEKEAKDLLSHLKYLLKDQNAEFLNGDFRNIWVVKPHSTSKGSGVECHNDPWKILKLGEDLPGRLVQKYIERPLLAFCNKKFDLRQWVFVRSFSPLKAYMFSTPYLRICYEKFDIDDLHSKNRHVSNWEIYRKASCDAGKSEESIKHVTELFAILNQKTGEKDYWEHVMKPKIKYIIIETLKSGKNAGILQRQNCFEVYGFDILIDERLNPWLLEVNLSPACNVRSKWQGEMLQKMTDGMFELLGFKEKQKKCKLNNCEDSAERSAFGEENSKEWSHFDSTLAADNLHTAAADGEEQGGGDGGKTADSWQLIIDEH